MRTRASECARQCGSVAAVITSTAENQCLFALKFAETTLDCVEAGATSRLHQQQRWNVKVVNGETIDFAYLFGGEYRLHGPIISAAGLCVKNHPNPDNQVNPVKPTFAAQSFTGFTGLDRIYRILIIAPIQKQKRGLVGRPALPAAAPTVHFSRMS